MPQVLQGEIPPGADAPVTAQAASSGGGPLALSPRTTRLLQTKLTEAGFPTDNVFGIWLAGSEIAARAFQKAKGLDITSTRPANPSRHRPDFGADRSEAR